MDDHGGCNPDYLNRVYIKEKIIMIKLLDFKKNIAYCNPVFKPKYNRFLDKVKPKLINYEKRLQKFKAENNIY